MEFSAKQASALIKAKSFEEFCAVLADFVQVNADEAKKLYEKFHGSPELSDEELANISGGAMYDQNGREVVSYRYEMDEFNPCGDKGILFVEYADGSTGIFDGVLPDFGECDSRGRSLINSGEYDAIMAAYNYYNNFSIIEY